MSDTREDEMAALVAAHDTEWLAADYHLASTYSCRAPLSSMSSGLALPAPGPATVRLALIRTAIELFGIAYTRETLFPTIRSATIRIRPPEWVGMSDQSQRAYKGRVNSEKADGGDHVRESLVYREVANAGGPMTVYIAIPHARQDDLTKTLMAIGYWGQADSLACCMGVHHHAPRPEECAAPLVSMGVGQPLGPLITSIVSEFRNGGVEWDDVTPVLSGRSDAIRMELYMWPMVVSARHDVGKILRRRSSCKE